MHVALKNVFFIIAQWRTPCCIETEDRRVSNKGRIQ